MKQKPFEVRELPLALRPREMLVKHGVQFLSDTELLTILLGSGSRDCGVGTLSRELLKVLEHNGFRADLETMQKIRGLGQAKAAQIAAALEFSRRALYPSRRKITSPGDVYPLVAHYSDRQQEYFLTLSLNGAHEVTAVRIVSIGLVNRTVVHPREVFAEPLMDRAAAIICCHNHPSGNLEPSGEDREVTHRLKATGDMLGVPLLDHVIFGENGYHSFLESGEL